jgi:hypothetical protein
MQLEVLPKWCGGQSEVHAGHRWISCGQGGLSTVWQGWGFLFLGKMFSGAAELSWRRAGLQSSWGHVSQGVCKQKAEMCPYSTVRFQPRANAKYRRSNHNSFLSSHIHASALHFQRWGETLAISTGFGLPFPLLPLEQVARVLIPVQLWPWQSSAPRAVSTTSLLLKPHQQSLVPGFDRCATSSFCLIFQVPRGREVQV